MACETVPTAPIIDCEIEGQTEQCVIDTGAVITVIKKRRDLPISRLKLKGVTNHKANLYGPIDTTFKIQDRTFTFPVYEADITESLIGIDFLQRFEIQLDLKYNQIKFRKSDDASITDSSTVVFTLGKTKMKGVFKAGKVYYLVETANKSLLKPNELTKVQAKLMVDDITQAIRVLSLDSGSNTPEEDANTQQRKATKEQKKDGHHGKTKGGTLNKSMRTSSECTMPGIAMEVDDFSTGHGPISISNSVPPSMSRSVSQSPGELSKSQNKVLQNKDMNAQVDNMQGRIGNIQLGMFLSNPAFGCRTSKLPPTVIAESGVVPCMPALMEITMQNMGDKCLEIPKNTTLGEVFVLHPRDLGDSFLEDPEDDIPQILMINTDEQSDSYSSDTDTDISDERHICTINHEAEPFTDAEYDPVPKLPEIRENEPLPTDLQDMINRCQTLNTDEKKQLENILRKHHDVFCKDSTSFGKCKWLKFRIDTGDHPPIKQQARPIPLHYRQAVADTINKYLECGAIKPSQSAWASPILCVMKKTGEVRVCIDYRALNSITRVPATPIPRVQDILQHLSGKQIYHAFDLAHGYHNLEVHEEDQPKTAIILPENLGLPHRQYEFTRLSFGLSAAPGAFQSVTDRLVTKPKEPNPQNDLGQHVAVYLDDICIAGQQNAQMFQTLTALFNRVRASGLLFKASKCFLFQAEVPLLGHIISKEGIKADDDKINKIIHWPAPANVKELRSWIGLITYYAKYLPHMATTAAPLYKLLKARVEYKWSKECEKAFQLLKEQLTTAPVLGSPDVTKGPFTLTCDASLTGLGAVLTQEQDGKDTTLAYWSKTLNQAQRNYCATHRELLALVESIKAFNHYLAGAPFLVKTDHAALQWLKTFKNPTGKLARWLERLAPYKFQVVHVKGTPNNIGHADALSRRPERPCTENCNKCNKLEHRDQEALTLSQEMEYSQFQIIHSQQHILTDEIKTPIVLMVSHEEDFMTGLARNVEEKFQIKQEFLAAERFCPGVTAIQKESKLIINMIVTTKYYHAPSHEELQQAFITLKQWLLANNIDTWSISEDIHDNQTLTEYLTTNFADTTMTIMLHLLPQTNTETNCQDNCATCKKWRLKELTISPQNVKINWTNVVPEGLTQENIMSDQLQDNIISLIMKAVQTRKRPDFQEIMGQNPKTRSLWHQFQSLTICNGVLYRKFEHPNGNSKLEQLQLILPTKHIENTIKTYHEQLGLGNHYGVSKTTAYLKKFFWWPGMQNDINSVISQCKVCTRFKGPKTHLKPPLKLFQEGVLHGRWHVDICGPFPTSTEGYKYILVAVEAFSAWPVVVPMKTQTATTIAEALITHVFSIFGSPLSILTDQGRAFESELFKEIMDLYNIKKYRTSSFHPAANGKAERWVKTLKQHLAMLVEKDQKHWPKYLPFIAQAYRSMPHTSTTFSPYEVMFGATMRSPLEMTQGTPPGAHHFEQAYPYWVRETLQTIHDVVRGMSLKAATKMKEYYDRTAGMVYFEVGDKVYLYHPRRKKGVAPKLTSPWEGPYTILNIINDCNARIQLDKSPNTKLIVHMDRLATYPHNQTNQNTQTVTAAWLTYVVDPDMAATNSQSAAGGERNVSAPL